MKKGFTLIELLAVLVVLAVISLITTPVVIGVIESSQKNSFKITCNEIYNAYDQYDISEDVGKNNICNIFDFSSDKENVEFLGNTKYVPISKLELKGEVPTSGVYKICSDVRILTISNGKYTCIKDENDTQILDGGLPDNDITSPTIDNITLTSTTNSIRVIVNAKEEDGIITKYYYKINGEVTTSESNIKTYENLDKNTEYEIEVIVENKSGLKSNSVVKKVTTKNINNPEIKQINQNPVSGYTWATSRTIQITYSNTNITNPVYYFKSSVGVTVANGVVTASCGTETNPGTCTNSNVTSLVADTWYKTNNTSLNVTYQTNGILYALTSDGNNISGTSTYTVSKVSAGIPTVPVITGGSTDWTNTSRTISIKTESTEISGIEKYQYYVSTSPTDQIGGEWLDGTSMIISTSGIRYIYMRAIANNGNTSEVSNYQISKIDKTPPTINAYSGTMLYSDPYFLTGINGVTVYNNAANSNVTITRKAISGTYNGYGIEIKTVGTAAPGHGGFTFITPTAANKEFITIIKAKIPVGYKINWATNSVGTGYTAEWLTSQDGTGNWQTYIFRLKCGSSGSFSSTNFFYLTGGLTATASQPVTWQVQCATTIDTTKYSTSNYIIFAGKDIESGMTSYGINQSSTTEPSMISENIGWWAGGYTANGTYYVWMKDAVGNVSKVPVSIRYVDRTLPTVTVNVNGKTATFSFSDNVGIAGYGVNTSSTSAPSFTSTTSTSATWTASSSGTYYVWVKDVAGNLNKTSFTISSSAFCSYNTGQQWTYSYTGGVQSFTVPCNGTYKLEVWGAQGGSNTSNNYTELGGKGGYSSGKKILTKNSILYLVVGGQGSEETSGGYNGGGSCLQNLQCAGGGGATHIATSNRGILANYSSYKTEVLIVAGGGGGGGGSHDNNIVTNLSPVGGTGGGTSGGNGTVEYSGASNFCGMGGTQSLGGTGRTPTSDTTGINGSFGQGGNGVQYAGGGGGAGWYGGGAGGNYNGGMPGGGGSGYIGGVTGGSMSNGQRSGNGYVRITLESISN